MAELGKKYCVYCLAEVSPLRFRCTECQDIELCPECFSAGAEIGHHRRYHGYQLVDGGRFTLWGPEAEGGWTSREEQLLLDAIEQFGFGNWVSRRAPGAPAGVRAPRGRGGWRWAVEAGRPAPASPGRARRTERVSQPPKVTQQEVAEWGGEWGESGHGWLPPTPHPRAVFPAFWGDLRWCLPSAPLGRGRTPQKGVRGTQAALRLDSSRVPQEGVGFAWRTVC